MNNNYNKFKYKNNNKFYKNNNNKSNLNLSLITINKNNFNNNNKFSNNYQFNKITFSNNNLFSLILWTILILNINVLIVKKLKVIVANVFFVKNYFAILKMNAKENLS